MWLLKCSLKHFGVAVAVLLTAGIFNPVIDVQRPAFAAGTGPTGVIVPLYIYPGEQWDVLIEIKNSNSAVPIVAVINPDNGPGSSKDPNYVVAIQELKAAGIIVLGYTWTDYGDRSSAAVRKEISRYKNWYAVDGIFFDAMSNLKGKLKYYSNLDSFTKARGLTLTVGNPGTDTRPIYIGSVDNIVIYESPDEPALSYLGGWHANHDKANFSFVSYDVSSLDESYVANATQHVGFMYITDDDLPNPYDSLPDYLGNLVSAIGAANVSN